MEMKMKDNKRNTMMTISNWIQAYATWQLLSYYSTMTLKHFLQYEFFQSCNAMLILWAQNQHG